MNRPAIHTRDLRVDLDGSPVLRGVDLTVPSGESVAIMGENGSGKSTLLRTLLGLVPASGGHAEIFGAAVTSPRALPWSRIGYVPQRLAPVGGMPTTALEVVRTGLLVRPRLRLPRHATARARSALSAVGLDHRADQPVAHMSGGQQQRVAIARALVRAPDLLILDEPATGVDQRRQAELARILTDLRGRGHSMLLVLHDLGHFAPLLDRALILEGGRVAREELLGHLGGAAAADPHCADGEDDPGEVGVLATAPNELGW
ncbi:metal ABC transporter ATP-binding protein [Pseudactinotalea sp. HY158]|uniref:metal ABC transporter ATP-binding protein n=1 Tax=Pseudactinotalea sp. HY158 TaxID=2654547 RepID=UPI001E332AEF|nr:metal ABC transporter ATP-binding protein [Pseudactinotalea sp. HY158]